MQEFTSRGGELEIREADVESLERYAGSHDLVVVATGKGALASLFGRDTEKSPYDTPQRVLALTYVTGMEPNHNYACFATLAGDTGDDTFAHLRRSVELLPRFREDARRDDDFAAVRDDPRFEEALR